MLNLGPRYESFEARLFDEGHDALLQVRVRNRNFFVHFELMLQWIPIVLKAFKYSKAPQPLQLRRRLVTLVQSELMVSLNQPISTIRRALRLALWLNQLPDFLFPQSDSLWVRNLQIKSAARANY